ncbi:hypothetical protein ASPWEDRAFT_29874 [Aspergillus wentii DTO 134E9]|uniref:DUF1445 domain-containing protein n=1 Tax=Aspergillus wentii DTO 134E9 TaxID=1073089 RepID=A0A1L9RCS8_ASPWE|nr:uncharacterized protein ASPWEDRAFT_29874 [Aspergillus wentii DTO 134E9]KAI9924305.1 hypothetical protein MW887_007255 [Aspergillus wentii]OJJ32726.1 hypothetical protein ASPWEDRAFT_29874 [Aspergillus wentii DTO 134E9]
MGSIAVESSASSPAHHARLLSRQNHITNTAGLAPGYLQANLLILPSKHAQDFHNLCLRNPVSCPLLGITLNGDPHSVRPKGCIKSADFDIRTDFPAYRVYKNGKFVKNRRDLTDVWTSDYVGFLIGCSFSFEDALAAAGLQPRHQKTGTIVAMYRSNIPLLPAGVFTGGKCIVSMRPYKPEDIERVREVTRPFLSTHGEPVAWGWDGAKELGIENIGSPDFGEPQVFEDGEIPVFWACGVTPQMAVESAGDKLDGLVFSHEPGNMLVTDWTIDDLERLKGSI